MIETIGCLHVHSKISGGTHSIQELAMTARQSGVDFIVLAENWRVEEILHLCGYREHVLVIPGAENEAEGVHFLSVGQNKFACRKDWSVCRCLEETQMAGGKSFLAHPERFNFARARLRMLELARSHPNILGIELWSMMERWMYSWNWLKAFLHMRVDLAGPSPRLLKSWDMHLISGRRLAVIGSVDRYNLLLFNLPLDMFKVKNPLKKIRTHVFVSEITGDAGMDSNAIIRSLCLGNAFIANDEICDSKNTRFLLKKKNAVLSACGEIMNYVSPEEDLSLMMMIPKRAEIRLVKNGEIIDESEDLSKEWYIHEPGVYRAEVRLNSVPWIFTNPFYLIQKSRQEMNWLGEESVLAQTGQMAMSHEES